MTLDQLRLRVVVSTQRRRVMQFVYQGFTHQGDIRSFNFQGKEEREAPTNFSILVDLLLFARNHVAVQDGPGFCLQLLTDACASTPECLDRLRHYTVVEEDLRPIMVDRANRAAIKVRKQAHRRIGRKPSDASQLGRSDSGTAPVSTPPPYAWGRSGRS